MSVQKRKCSSCKFFNESPLPGNGWCTHHKRQLSSEVRILVRKGELACRDPWGSDYWISKSDTGVAADTGEAAHLAPPERLVAGPRADDQITSVTASFSAGTSRTGSQHVDDPVSLRETRPDDVIVSQPLMLPEDARSSISEQTFERDRDNFNPNLPAHEDQQERVRLIARGNRDAIVKARERVVLRRGGPGAMQAADVRDADGVDGRPVDRHDDGPDNAHASYRAANGAEEPASRRYGRRPRDQRSGNAFPSRGYADPTPPVPPEEAGDWSRHTPFASHSADASRFESVPDIKPDVELPRLRQFLQSSASETDAPKGAHVAPDEQRETSYDRVLQRAQAIKTATQKERDSRVIRNRQIGAIQPAASRVTARTTERDDPASSPAAPTDFRRLHGDVEHGTYDTGSFLDSETKHDEPAYASVANAEEIMVSHDDDDYPDDDLYAEHDATYERTDNQFRSGPRESWWRGLSLGLGRRPQTYATAANDAYDQEDWSDEEIWDEPDQSGNQRDEPDGSERVFSFASAYDENASDEPATLLRDPRLAEEELIDYELTDEVLETSFADDTDRIQAESWREESHPRGSYRDEDAADVIRSRRDSGFALDDHHDMDAFRAALFGRGPDDSVESAPDRDRHGTVRHQDPPVVPHDERSAQRKQISPADALPTNTRRRYVEEPAFDIRNFVEQDDDLLDMRVQIAPDVPRACHTCRNFRPSETGERGWCTNDFAFTHRQMVNADDMPCQSSIGCWWLPSDHTWMPAGDLVARDNPTPLTDRLIARRHGHDVEDDRARSELYVREM